MKASERVAAWRAANPEKHRAHGLVRLAKRHGVLTAKPCQRCGQEKTVQAHHPDHAHALEVVWLCASCHARWHRKTITIPGTRSDARPVVDNRTVAYLTTDLRIDIAHLIDRLSRRERFVIRCRHWYGCTLEETATGLGVTRQRACQIEHKALAYLAGRLATEPAHIGHLADLGIVCLINENRRDN